MKDRRVAAPFEFLVGAGKRLAGAGRRFVCDERGSTAIEYGLIAGIIVVAIIGSISAIGDVLKDELYRVAAAGLGSTD